jgi:hypothetical protein
MVAGVSPSVIDLINQAQTANLNEGVVLASGAGKAYQSVAQSAAIAVQDATDALRNVTTIATAASGVAIAHLLAAPDTDGRYTAALKHAQDMMAKATTDYGNIGQAAAKILNGFPPAGKP